jgi:hypothetical protein
MEPQMSIPQPAAIPTELFWLLKLDINEASNNNRKEGNVGKEKGRKLNDYPLREVVANFPFAVGFTVLPPKAFINKLGNISIAQLC